MYKNIIDSDLYLENQTVPVESGDYYLDKILNKKIHNLSRKKIYDYQISINNFLFTRSVIHPTNFSLDMENLEINDKVTVTLPDHSKQNGIIQNGPNSEWNYQVNIHDQLSTFNVKSIQSISPKTKKQIPISMIINEYELDNSSKHIFFNIMRKTIHYSDIVNLNILPLEKINIKEFSIYTLHTIVLYYEKHYVMIYRKNNEYYLVNDIEDFVSIGPYSNLVHFEYRGIPQIILRHSVFLHYYQN